MPVLMLRPRPKLSSTVQGKVLLSNLQDHARASGSIFRLARRVGRSAPLIAQHEFNETDVARAVALIVAIAQAGYAFAPVVFGLIRDLSAGFGNANVPLFFIAAATIQAAAALCFLAGRR